MALEEKLPRATQYVGKIKIGELIIPCAVLDDGTRLISERGVTKALGAKRGGAHWRRKKAGREGADLPVFVSSPNLIPYIDSDLFTSLQAPTKYLSRTGQKIGYGREATVLPKICDVWLKARDAGALHPTQLHIARNAEILMRGLAQVGIIALVDEATGYQYDRERSELERFLALYLTEERLKWAKTFPDEFFKQIYRLKGWPYPRGTTKRTPFIGKIINKIVFAKLPEGVLPKLRKLNPVIPKTKRRRWKHHQFFSEDIGQPDLREHLIGLMTLQKAAANWREFDRMVERAFPGRGPRQIEMDEEIDV